MLTHEEDLAGEAVLEVGTWSSSVLGWGVKGTVPSMEKPALLADPGGTATSVSCMWPLHVLFPVTRLPFLRLSAWQLLLPLPTLLRCPPAPTWAPSPPCLLPTPHCVSGVGMVSEHTPCWPSKGRWLSTYCVLCVFPAPLSHGIPTALEEGFPNLTRLSQHSWKVAKLGFTPCPPRAPTSQP
jgi:hypothetical protein